MIENQSVQCADYRDVWTAGCLLMVSRYFTGRQRNDDGNLFGGICVSAIQSGGGGRGGGRDHRTGPQITSVRALALPPSPPSVQTHGPTLPTQGPSHAPHKHV